MANRSNPGKNSPRPARPALSAATGITILQVLIIVAVALWIYWPALDGNWLWDDGQLVSHNRDLRSLAGLGRIWFATPATDYWPITWTALWIEWHLWGGNVLGYHLVSLALHLASALLIWRLLGRLGLRWGWLGGLLFVVHPLAVESVAWIAEIKNTLSLPFLLLSLDAFLDAEDGKKSGLWRSLLFYLAAVLCKTSVIMLPVLLLLYGWWKRGVAKASATRAIVASNDNDEPDGFVIITYTEIKRTAPYFVIALVMGLITIFFHNHAPETNDATSRLFLPRLAGAGDSLFFYLEKFALPIGLIPVYPRWALDPPSIIQLLKLPLFILFLILLWTQRGAWARHVQFGLAFFLVNLLPVLGFLNMTYMNITWVADHFVYLPMIGLIGLVVAGLEQLHARLPRPAGSCLIALLVAAIAWLGWEGRTYAANFTDSNTLWTYTLALNPDAYPAYTNLGEDLMAKGRVAEATKLFERVVQIRPGYANGHCDLGVAYIEAGRVADAKDQYESAIHLNPRLAEAHNNLGRVLLEAGQLPQARDEFLTAIDIDPDYAIARNNLGNVLLNTGQVPAAMQQYQQAIQLEPAYAEAYNGLGVALEDMGRVPEAITQFETALRIDPAYPNARANLARLQGRPNQ